MRSRRTFLKGAAALAGLATAACVAGGGPKASLPRAGMLRHPRLILTPGTAAEAAKALAGDPRGRAWRDEFLRRADRLLGEPVTTREFEAKRPVLLPTSRRVLERIQTFGVAHALTADDRFAERAKREMLAACGFPDWNPSHFLDVAEMGHAIALGYDWFFERLTGDERALVLRSLEAKALRPGLQEFASRRFWTTVTHNWNLVCNGGLTIAALAVADELPELAEEVLGRTLESARRGFSSFAPDGGWSEGPGYWEYATAYAVAMLAALETAGVSDGGLAESAGFAQSGAFAAHTTGPTGRVFNYADSGERTRRAPQHLWLARRYGRPTDAWPEFARTDASTALDLLWFMPAPPPPDHLDARFDGVAVATFRGSWTDPRATWLAIKGGDNAANHGNLDLGAFVLETGGERFAVDLGNDDYALPGYFGGQRFTYYRTMSAGQNVLLRGGANQNRTARAAIVDFASRPDFAAAVVDLSQAYEGWRHRRGGALVGRRHVVLSDEFEGATPVPLAWQMHTRAAVALDGSTAVLTQGAARLHVRVLAPQGVVFEVAEATAPAPQNPNPGIRRLTLRLPSSGRGRLVILLSPDAGPGEDVTAAGLRQLSQWGGGG